MPAALVESDSYRGTYQVAFEAVREHFERVRPEVVIHTAYRQDGPDAHAINGRAPSMSHRRRR